MLDQHETLACLDAIAAGLASAPLKHELQAVAHKIRYPMSSIIAKVPGPTIKGKAQIIGVSRQCIYIWLSERFRPTITQAKRLAHLTGVPVEQIVDNGFEANYDAGREADKKAARVAGKRKTPQRRYGGTPGKGRRVVRSQTRKRRPRKVHS